MNIETIIPLDSSLLENPIMHPTSVHVAEIKNMPMINDMKFMLKNALSIKNTKNEGIKIKKPIAEKNMIFESK